MLFLLLKSETWASWGNSDALAVLWSCRRGTRRMCRSGKTRFQELDSPRLLGSERSSLKYTIIFYSLIKITTVTKNEILLSNVEACSNDVESRNHDADWWLVRRKHFEVEGDFVDRDCLGACEILQDGRKERLNQEFRNWEKIWNKPAESTSLKYHKTSAFHSQPKHSRIRCGFSALGQNHSSTCSQSYGRNCSSSTLLGLLVCQKTRVFFCENRGTEFCRL